MKVIRRNRKSAAAIVLAIIIVLLLALPVTYAFSQEADDAFPQRGNPCAPAGAGTTPIAFQIYPQEGPPGSFFIIQGKPHDPHTVGPGSDVSFSWSEVPSSNKSTEVNPDGSFTALMQVPASFAPGPHKIMYAEASPYVQCPEFNVTSGPPADSSPLLPVDALRSILTTIQKVVNFIMHPTG